MLQWSQNREAKQKRATLITVASKTPKKGFREKDQQKKKVAVYNRKSISSLLIKDLAEWWLLMPGKKGSSHLGSKGPSTRLIDNEPTNQRKRQLERLNP
jgi:hypothetical protein